MTQELTVENLPTLSDELLQEIGAHGNKYSIADKLNVISTYYLTKSEPKTEQITGINRNAFKNWKKFPWWQKVTLELIKFDNAEIVTNLTHTITSASEQIYDRIINGEYIYDSNDNMVYQTDENGEFLLDDDGNKIPKRKKLKAHTLAIDGIAIPTQQRAQILLDPKTQEKAATQSLLRDTVQELIEISKQTRNVTKDSEIIEQ